MKRWIYSHAEICRVGGMICTACQGRILDGQFRYRDIGHAYNAQHQACSLDDPEWARIEQRKLEREEYFVRRKAALQAYINVYGAPDDDLIDECVAARPSPSHSSTDAPGAA